MAISGSLKIGTLLLQAELVQEQDLMDSVQVSKRMKLPLGRVLIGQGLLSDELLNAALSAQSLIRDKVVSHEIAVKALIEAKTRSISFEEALREFGLRAEQLEFTTKLGQLLVDCGMISMVQRNEALQTSLAAGLPIGRVLVIRRALSNTNIYAALSAQVMIRASQIDRKDAIEALKTTRSNDCTFETALVLGGYIKPTVSTRIMLGELLVISNQISEVEFLMALENSLTDDLPLGKVLVDHGLITWEKLDRTLEVQEKIAEGKMTATFAAEYLQHDDSESPGQSTRTPPSLGDLSTTNFGLKELLVVAKVITQYQAQSAHSEALAVGSSLEQVLLKRKLVTQNDLEAVTRCLVLYGMNTINAEEAILALHTWLSKRDELIDDVISRVAQRDLI